MTVKELMEKLAKCNPQSLVVINTLDEGGRIAGSCYQLKADPTIQESGFDWANKDVVYIR